LRALSALWSYLLLAVPFVPTALATPATGYEAERTARVLANLGFVEDPSPAGKRIVKVHVVSHDVFAEDEPWPTFFNVFHAKTDEDVVTRELLFREGETWDQARVDESMRNLRNQGIFAFVRISPVRPADASSDSVEALVYTRDLWSLRLESSFALTDGLINQLSLTLVERNLGGRNAQAALTFDLRPANLSLGGFFANRRLLGTRLSVSSSLEFVLSRAEGALEGTRGALSFGLPLVDLRQPWGFELSAVWNATVGRQLSGADLLTWDDPATLATEAIPRIWNQDIAQVVAAGQRQFGRDLIHRISFGYAAYLSSWAPHPDTGLTPDTPASDAFTEAVLPPSREQLYPYFRWQTFKPTWQTFVELAAFGLSEDIRTGPWTNLFFGAPLKAFGSDVNALTWEASAGLVLAPALDGDHALIDLLAGLDGRLEGGEVIDQGYRLRFRGATPRFDLGRLVLLADLESRVRDTSRALVTLGGDNGLRGYASQAFYGFGADRLRLGAELRSPPLVLGSVHIGGVLFYDAGGIGEELSDLALHHALGLGMRLLLPQFNRFAFRFDLGVPLDADGFEVVFTLGSTQAIPLTALEDDKL
jgi:hypothetical protein